MNAIDTDDSRGWKWDQWKVDVPCGEAGDCKVQRFDISEETAAKHNMYAMIRGEGWSRRIRPGSYTRLIVGDGVMMSDTPAEVQDHQSFIWRAKGSVLVTGLGLGMVARALLANPEVCKVTVLESSEHVLALVADHYRSHPQAARLCIVQGDAFTWKPPAGEVYDYIWHDIWPTICAENLPQMATLHRRFARYLARPHGFQQSWCRRQCEKLRAADRNTWAPVGGRLDCLNELHYCDGKRRA